MKKYTFLSLFLLLFATLTSCDNDHEGPVIYLGMGTITKPANVYHITFDNDLTAAIPDSSLLVISGTNRNGQRAIISFHKIDENNKDAGIFLHTILPVLTKPFFYRPTAEESDSLGYDPVRINKAWIGGNHLNVEFTYRAGQYTGRPHFINMADYGLKNSDGIARLEFRHNNNNDAQEVIASGYVSFPLGENAPSQFCISYKDLDGDTRELLVPEKKGQQPQLQSENASRYTLL